MRLGCCLWLGSVGWCGVFGGHRGVGANPLALKAAASNRDNAVALARFLLRGREANHPRETLLPQEWLAAFLVQSLLQLQHPARPH